MAFVFVGHDDGKLDLRAFLCDALNLPIEQNIDAILLHDFENFGSDVSVLAAQQFGRFLNNSHAAAEAPEQLAQLKSNIAAADHEEMLRHGIQLHDRGAVEIGNAF